MFQSVSQLMRVYPEDCNAILENCATSITLGRHPSFVMSRTLFEQVFGDVPPSVLFDLDADQSMVRRAGKPSRILRKLDYLADAPFKGRFDVNPLHEATER